jgi:hypothetical protein
MLMVNGRSRRGASEEASEQESRECDDQGDGAGLTVDMEFFPVTELFRGSGRPEPEKDSNGLFGKWRLAVVESRICQLSWAVGGFG